MSARIQALNLRRVDGKVYADLPTDQLGGERVTMESTCAEFTRLWTPATYEMTTAERDEANRLLCSFEDAATDWAWRESQKPQDYTGALDRLAARLEARNAR